MKRIALAVFVFLLAAQVHAEAKVRNVAIFLYDGAEILDWTGPAEVLAAAGHSVSHEKPAFHIFTVAKTKAPITSQGFIKTIPDYSIADAPKIDVLVIPGGNTGPTQQDATAMEFLRRTATDAEVTLTVCTGAAPIAKLGFLDGLEITTWYGAIDRLQQNNPKVQVKRGRRFVDNGKFITTAGVSAGIDGALHLVGRLLGRMVAEQTAQYMEYHWSPEAYLANSYPMLNPSTDDRGRAMQLAGMHRGEKNWSAASEIYQRLLAENPADHDASYQLAHVLHASEKHEDAVRAYERASASETFRANALYNIACIRAVQKQNDQATAYLARAVDAGFRNRDLLLNDPDLAGVREQAKVLAAKLQ
jgi:putative intracellular protease/amidase